MIKRMSIYFGSISPVFLDGSLYALLAVFGSWLGILSSETARTIIGAKTLFWVTSGFTTLNSGLLAIKMFRSTTFAEHRQDKKDKQQAVETAQATAVLNAQNQVNKGKTDDTTF